jgi:hypothetical protein
MNPVDHPHGGVSARRSCGGFWDVAYLTWRYYRVTINISVRRRPSRGTLRRVRRRVSLLRGGRVCSVVPRRPRIKGFYGSTSGQGVHRIALVFCCFVVTGLRRRTGRLGHFCKRRGREMKKRFPNAVGSRLVYGDNVLEDLASQGTLEQTMQSGDALGNQAAQTPRFRGDQARHTSTSGGDLVR